jgi:hypothetical protein
MAADLVLYVNSVSSNLPSFFRIFVFLEIQFKRKGPVMNRALLASYFCR